MNDLKESDYKADFEIADRYINFSSELLRLSLLALSGLSTVIVYFIQKEASFTLSLTNKFWILITIILFALTAAGSLVHRFYATDSMSYHVAYLRKGTPDEKDG